jgi:hypothetical protein
MPIDRDRVDIFETLNRQTGRGNKGQPKKVLFISLSEIILDSRIDFSCLLQLDELPIIIRKLEENKVTI